MWGGDALPLWARATANNMSEGSENSCLISQACNIKYFFIVTQQLQRILVRRQRALFLLFLSLLPPLLQKGRHSDARSLTLILFRARAHVFALLPSPTRQYWHGLTDNTKEIRKKSGFLIDWGLHTIRKKKGKKWEKKLFGKLELWYWGFTSARTEYTSNSICAWEFHVEATFFTLVGGPIFCGEILSSNIQALSCEQFLGWTD